MIMVPKCCSFVLLSILCLQACSAFTSYSPITSRDHWRSLKQIQNAGFTSSLGIQEKGERAGVAKTRLNMMDEEGNGPGLLTSIGIVLIMIIFVGSAFVPLMGGGDRDLSIADSVVTRQDAPQKLKNYESSQDRLYRATIQEKLSAVPVFYLSEGGNMQTDIFLSYQQAADAATGKEGVSVKVTSLDQVMYPLILKRGRMRMAPPPSEVEKAEAALSENPEKLYRLIPSKAAVDQANEYKMNLLANDIPLFVADRLAFAGAKGPQLPLFVDKNDCMLSYQRLRSGKSSLPEQPNIRTTSLLDELYSMEKGTRPGVSQLAFYATAEDVNKAASMVDTLQ